MNKKITNKKINESTGNPRPFQSSARSRTRPKALIPEKNETLLRKSEERFRMRSGISQEGIAVHDKGVIVEANQALAKMFGYKLSEMTGMNARILTTPESWKIIKKNIDKGGSHSYETVATRKDGSTFICYLNGKPYHYKGRALRIATFRDITERRRTEEKYYNILDNIQEGYFEVNLAGDFTFLNDSMCRIYGYPKKELMGMNNRQYTQKDVARHVFHAFNQVYKTGINIKEVESHVIRKDGTKRYIEGSVSLLKDSSGTPTGFRGVVRDITDRKKMEEKLLLEGQKFRSLADHSLDIIILLDTRGIVTYINPAVERILGYKVEERIGAYGLEHIHPDDIQSAAERFIKLATDMTSPVLSMETRLKDKEGNWHVFETVGSNIVKDNAVETIIIRQHDITAYKLAENALRYERDLSTVIIDSLPGLFYVVDEEFRLIRWNDNFMNITGYSADELRDMRITDFHPDPDKTLIKEKIRQIFLQGENASEEDVFLKSGDIKTFMFISRKVQYEGKLCLLGTGIDITDKKKALTELKQFAENLENANIALRVLNDQRNTDQKEFENKLQSNINDLVMPYLKKLKQSELNDRDKNYVRALESNLGDVLSPLMSDFRSAHQNLTPQEMQIVDLIKQGKKTKEIADMLNAAAGTIATHRNNIRKKLNLRNSKINLRSHILSHK